MGASRTASSGSSGVDTACRDGRSGQRQSVSNLEGCQVRLQGSRSFTRTGEVRIQGEAGAGALGRATRAARNSTRARELTCTRSSSLSLTPCHTHCIRTTTGYSVCTLDSLCATRSRLAVAVLAPPSTASTTSPAHSAFASIAPGDYGHAQPNRFAHLSICLLGGPQLPPLRFRSLAALLPRSRTRTYTRTHPAHDPYDDQTYTNILIYIIRTSRLGSSSRATRVLVVEKRQLNPSCADVCACVCVSTAGHCSLLQYLLHDRALARAYLRRPCGWSCAVRFLCTCFARPDLLRLRPCTGSTPFSTLYDAVFQNPSPSPAGTYDQSQRDVTVRPRSETTAS